MTRLVMRICSCSLRRVCGAQRRTVPAVLMMQKNWDSCNYSCSSEFCSSEDFFSRRAERWRDASGAREQNKITLCQSLEGSLTPLRCHYTGRAFTPRPSKIDHYLYPVSQNNIWPVPDASKHITERARCQAHQSIEQTMHAPFSDLRLPATKGFRGQMTQR